MSGVVVWMTGKPSSGKSTLARALQARLSSDEVAACVLDGDEVRSAFHPRHGYDPKSRDEYYATLANLAALLARQGLVVMVPATAHLKTFRDRARARRMADRDAIRQQGLLSKPSRPSHALLTCRRVLHSS